MICSEVKCYHCILFEKNINFVIECDLINKKLTLHMIQMKSFYICVDYECGTKWTFITYFLQVVFTLFVFVNVLWCPTQIMLCFFLFFFLRSLCCQLLWIVHCWLRLRKSLTFIIYSPLK
jgi:hypothetical protein